MDITAFSAAQQLGEGNSVEFKRCGNEVEHDVFESVCSFANRFGGDIYLGVLNDGTVVGVNKANCVAMMRNVVNTVNNPNVVRPSVYVEVESFEVDGRTGSASGCRSAAMCIRAKATTMIGAAMWM